MNPESDLTIIIPCHNYDMYLGECLTSIKESTVQPTRIVVVDDKSDTTAALNIANQHNVTYSWVDFNNLHKVRAYALENWVSTRYVMFLDADNKLHPNYIEDALTKLRSFREVAFVFPVLQGFDGTTDIMHATDKAPFYVRSEDIERINMCDGNSMWRTEVLKQSLVMRLNVSSVCSSADWRMARNVLRMARWAGAKNQYPLFYRVHQNQMSKRQTSYYIDANLSNERITIIVALSGRKDTWHEQRQWLLDQTWPNVRLLIMNGTHEPMSVGSLGLNWWDSSITIERFDAGLPRLADKDRRKHDRIREDVECAVAGIYNKAVSLTNDEFVFFLEDDVIPTDIGLLHRLMQHMNHDVFGVSALYKHRYHPNKAVAFSVPISRDQLLPFEGPELEQVDGTGFGCLLARRSILQRYPLSGDNPINPHYDCDLAQRVKGKFRWLLCRSYCKHLTNTGCD